MRNALIWALVMTAAATLGGSAGAQPNPPTLATPGPKECPPGVASPAPQGNATTGGPSLSEQLSQSKGVICPPAGIDPGLDQTPPGGGRTPVIPPPGSPGGNPNVVPK
jgi:hypothetical protein